MNNQGQPGEVWLVGHQVFNHTVDANKARRRRSDEEHTRAVYHTKAGPITERNSGKDEESKVWDCSQEQRSVDEIRRGLECLMLPGYLYELRAPTRGRKGV